MNASGQDNPQTFADTNSKEKSVFVSDAPYANCYPTEGLRVSPKKGEKRFLCAIFGLFWIMAGAMAFTADMLVNKSVSWSLEVMVFCVWAILQSASIVAFAKRHPFVNIILSYVLANGAIAAISIPMTNSARFYLVLGLPISSILLALAAAVTISKKLTRLKTLNLVAVFLLLAIPCAIGADLLISTYVGKTAMSWSFLAIAFCLPAAGLCVCLYFYLRRKEAFFHR